MQFLRAVFMEIELKDLGLIHKKCNEHVNIGVLYAIDISVTIRLFALHSLCDFTYVKVNIIICQRK